MANITKLPKSIIDNIGLLLKSPSSKIITDLNEFFESSFTYGTIVFLYLFMKKIKIIDSLKTIPLKSRILLTAIILNRIIKTKDGIFRIFKNQRCSVDITY